jgi:hypothetical protein
MRIDAFHLGNADFSQSVCYPTLNPLASPETKKGGKERRERGLGRFNWNSVGSCEFGFGVFVAILLVF